MQRPAKFLLGCTAGAGLILLSACDFGSTAVEFSGLELTPGPHLLLDDYLIESTSGVRRYVHRPVRDANIPNPLITGEQDGNIAPYLAVLRDGGRFKIWYNTSFDDRGSNQSRLGYLESTDGIHWERPHKVLPDVEGHIRFGASVIHRPDGAGYLWGYYQDGGLKIASSPDGLSWTPIHPKELVKHDHDITGLWFDPVRKRYIGVLSTIRQEYTGGITHLDSRQTRLSVSTDLFNWEAPWDVLIPDARDELGTQFYAMDGFLARGTMLVGMVKILRDDLDVEGPTISPRGMGWTSLAWSRDGRNWIRDRAVFLAPDPAPGQWDHAFAWIDEQVVVGDSVYLYYGGYETGHKGDRSSEREIGLVTMPRDRYAGWEAGAEGGVMRSRLLRIRGSRLLLNVDADGGEVLVRARTVDGRDALGACDPISGDRLDAPLRCERELGSLNEPVRLEFEMRNARVYAWTVE